MKTKICLIVMLLSSNAIAQTRYNDPYGSYGSVPTVSNRMPNQQYQGSYQNSLDTFHQQQEQQRQIRQETQRQLDNMSPAERFGYQRPTPLGNR